MRAIRLYRDAGTWMFDDPAVGLEREPFVLGVPEMIDALLAKESLPLQEPFRMVFSGRSFPGSDSLSLVREDSGGGWYEHEGRSGWLCPALFRYFEQIPEVIHVRAEAI
jgi:hypothetical protein